MTAYKFAIGEEVLRARRFNGWPTFIRQMEDEIGKTGTIVSRTMLESGEISYQIGSWNWHEDALDSINKHPNEDDFIL